MCGTLVDGLTTVLRVAEPLTLVVAGRTDAGVHASGQVAHVDVPVSRYPGELASPTDPSAEMALLRRLAGVLPRDMRVTSVEVVTSAFDARFSATSRRYTYRVWDSVVPPDPLRRRVVLWHRRQLDLDAMNRAALPLVGEHDFLAFCRPREGARTTRTLLGTRCRRERDGTVAIEVVGQAFCHNQVRALVGALLPVGDGRRDEGWPAAVLSARERGRITVAPAHGLVLEEVRYLDA